MAWNDFSEDKIKRFIKKYYAASTMSLYVGGVFNKDDLVKKINKEFEKVPTKSSPLPLGVWNPSLQIEQDEIPYVYVGILYSLFHISPRDLVIGKMWVRLFCSALDEEETRLYNKNVNLTKELDIETVSIVFNVNMSSVVQTLEKVLGLLKKKIPSYYKEKFDKMKEDYTSLVQEKELYERFGELGSTRLLEESIDSIKWEDIEIFQSSFVNKKPAIAIYGNIDGKSIKQVKSFYSKLGE